MHTEQHPCKSMQATKARRKNARSIAAAKQKHFWANFSNRKTEVDKSTSRTADHRIGPASPNAVHRVQVPEHFLHGFVQVLLQVEDEQSCKERGAVLCLVAVHHLGCV